MHRKINYISKDTWKYLPDTWKTFPRFPKHPIAEVKQLLETQNSLGQIARASRPKLQFTENMSFRNICLDHIIHEAQIHSDITLLN